MGFDWNATSNPLVRPNAAEENVKKVFCVECGKDITNDTQTGAGNGTGSRFICTECREKKKKVDEEK